MARIFVVRHGNTFDPGDTITRVGGRTDLPLSRSGQAQAIALATHFSPIRFMAALASPLIRTRSTARTVLAARPDSPALLIAPFLREIDYGPDENQPEAAVEARIGAVALAAWDRDAIVPSGWKVDPDAIRAGWHTLLKRAGDLPDDANALIVTSNGIARFLPDATDGTPDGLDRKLKTGAWAEIVTTPQRAWITSWNRKP